MVIVLFVVLVVIVIVDVVFVVFVLNVDVVVLATSKVEFQVKILFKETMLK